MGLRGWSHDFPTNLKWGCIELRKNSNISIIFEDILHTISAVSTSSSFFICLRPRMKIHSKQEDQLYQRIRVMLRVTEYFVTSLKDIEDHMN